MTKVDQIAQIHFRLASLDEDVYELRLYLADVLEALTELVREMRAVSGMVSELASTQDPTQAVPAEVPPSRAAMLSTILFGTSDHAEMVLDVLAEAKETLEPRTEESGDPGLDAASSA